ncbi:MAG: hypothetical protein IJW36_02075 [Clostridia bacterium]|nr:hypothetical protein [Clostridia bacterium]
MGRGSSSSGGGSRGGSFGGGSSRGMSRSSFNSRSSHHWGRSHHHTTVIVGGHGHHYHGSGSPWIGVIVGAIFVLVGLFCVFGGFGQLFKSNDYASVSAKCIDNDYVSGWYYTTYEYTVNGTDYTNRSIEGWELPEDVGRYVTIYYLKSDPNVITEENPNDKAGAGIMIVVGFICAGMGAIPMVICIKALKQKKTTDTNAGESASVEQPKEEPTNKCPYCGARYKKSSDSCPKCGASRID